MTNETGLSGRKWSIVSVFDRRDPLSPLLKKRGITPEMMDGFMNPKIRDMLPDPHVLNDMDKASKALSELIMSGKRIGIYSDYDADGATSAGVLGRWVRMAGGKLGSVVIPDRKEHGYGPNADLISQMFEEGDEAVFILDSGTVASSVLNSLKASLRERIFIIDHHMPSGELPEVAAVVNPNREDQDPGWGHMAAVGVTFLLCVGAQREIIRSGKADKSSMASLMELLDYVAIGTVCDVVPLTGINRAFVSHGLTRINTSEDNPIGAILSLAGKKDDEVSSSDCGFIIGPRLNAEGRIGRSDAAAKHLLATDPEIILSGAKAMNDMNVKRQGLEKAATEEAIEQADGMPDSAVMICVTSGHEGVVGISASRIKERYSRPAIVLTDVGGGILKGSARSYDGFNIGDAIHHAVDAGLLIKGGGHGMAGGMTLHSDKIEQFRTFMDEELSRSEFGQTGPIAHYDMEIREEDATLATKKLFDSMKPFGRSNEEPSFVLRDATIGDVRVLSDKHVKATIVSSRGGKKLLDAILWGGVGTPSGDNIVQSKGKKITLAGRLDINRWNDREYLQLIIDDVLNE